MNKKFPDLTTDEEAEHFVAVSDLTEFDWSDMQRVRFELRKKDSSIHLRLPGPLLAEVKSHAQRAGIPMQRFIRMAIEMAVTPKPR